MIEGKTKTIVPGPEADTVLLQSKDVLTGGDAARVAAIASIGVMKTSQTVNVFSLLTKAGIPNAFIRQTDERSILCWACDMLPIEFVQRRRPWGSYLLRHPEESAETRFDNLVLERFHKQAMIVPPASTEPRHMDESAARAEYLRDGIWADGVYTDPTSPSAPTPGPSTRPRNPSTLNYPASTSHPRSHPTKTRTSSRTS